MCGRTFHRLLCMQPLRTSFFWYCLAHGSHLPMRATCPIMSWTSLVSAAAFQSLLSKLATPRLLSTCAWTQARNRGQGLGARPIANIDPTWTGTVILDSCFVVGWSLTQTAYFRALEARPQQFNCLFQLKLKTIAIANKLPFFVPSQAGGADLPQGAFQRSAGSPWNSLFHMGDH